MARTPVLERSGSLKVLGAAFMAMLIFFVWLTYAFFNKQFVDSVPVTVNAATAGAQLPRNADVKLRGMIVGEVRKIEAADEGVTLTLAMKPEMMKDVPADVSAQIIPKTLFGEKYVTLIPAENPSGESLKAGDVITKAEVPIEVEELLNDLYPLLDAVQPADLAYTLSAVSQALEGRGKDFGETLVTFNEYLIESNPDLPLLIDDLVNFGTVADNYASALPDFGALLRNSVVTGNTIVSKKSQLTAFYDEGSALADTLASFVDTNRSSLVELPKLGKVILTPVAKYSSTFPCFLGAMAELIPVLDSVFRDTAVHINLELLGEQPTGYYYNAADKNDPKNENVQANQQIFDESPYAQPTCIQLDELKDGNNPYPQENPFTVPPEVYKLVGVKSSHNKFGSADDFNRPAAGSFDLNSLVQPSMDGSDTLAQRELLNRIIGAQIGMSAADVPDIASLLISPVLRGSEVRVSEAN